MAKVTLEQANTIISAGQAKGREMGIGPLTIVVLDDGGHLVSMQREDKSGILRFEIAFGIGWTPGASDEYGLDVGHVACLQ